MAEQGKPGPGGILGLTAALAILFAGAVLLWSMDTRVGGLHPHYSVRRTDDRGAAVLFRLYERAGLEPRTWDDEFTALRQPGLLVLIAPAMTSRIGSLEVGKQGDILPHEVKALDDWVRRGGVAVICSGDSNPVYDGLGLITDEPAGSGSGAAIPVEPGALAEGVEEIETRASFGFKFGRTRSPMARTLAESGLEVEEEPPPIPVVELEEWVTLFARKADGRELPQVVTASRGRGLYVAVNSPWPATNLGVTMRQNARFMLNLAALGPPGGPIYFDEYHKRNVQRSLMGYIRSRGLLPVLLYGLLLLVVGCWRSGVRLGPATPLAADDPHGGGEYLRAVAALYATAGLSGQALQVLSDDFRRRLAAALRLRGVTEVTRIGEAYSLRTGRPAEEVKDALASSAELLGRAKTPESAALQVCRKMDEVDAALRSRAPGKSGGRRFWGRRPGGRSGR